MNEFHVTYTDIIKAETKEDAYDQIKKYCRDVADSGDVTAFEFHPVPSRKTLNPEP